METEGDFHDLHLNQWLLEQVQDLGFKRPSPIQYHCIPPILEGKLSL